MKLYKNILISAAVAIGLGGCNKVMDKTNLSAIDGALIYNDSSLAFLNLSYIYDNNLPGWFGSTGGAISGNGSFSEESYGGSKFFEGTVDQATVGDIGTNNNKNNVWGKIRKINEFIRDINNGSLPQYTKDKMTGEALFLRAFRYFDLVRLYGGVPLVLEPLDPVGEAAKQESMVPRNSTSECMAQIVKDLDFAINSLPPKWADGDDWGRITSGAAAAFKGRVLLTYASPQFNPNDLQDRWQAAYDANLQAKTLLTAGGFGLNSSYDGMWFTEKNNPEAVLITGYNTKTADQFKKNNNYDNQTRPSYFGSAGGSNQPSWEMVKAYRMKDGKVPGESVYAYSDTLFYKNRDPRFEKTIAYSGSSWKLLNAEQRIWTYFGTDGKTTEPKASSTGFYLKKAVNPALTVEALANGGTDWMEIRYAEVLLNLAEAACGINRLAPTQEAYAGIIAVRTRAGIDPGSDNLYGLPSTISRADMFSEILDERQVEFAFEGKRFWDLRRWKQVEEKLNGTRRHGLKLTVKIAGLTEANRNSMDLDVIYKTYFKFEYPVKDDNYDINWKPEYYFFAIPTSAINNNPNLEQTNLWGGTFDPLK